MTKITIAEFDAITAARLPFAQAWGIETLALAAGRATMRLPFRSDFLRPGGTIGGPMLMGLADLAMYAAVLSAAGPVELAVTSNLSITFLKKPPPLAVVAEAELLRLGRRLAYGEIRLYSANDGGRDLVAHATATYALPQ